MSKRIIVHYAFKDYLKMVYAGLIGAPFTLARQTWWSVTEPQNPVFRLLFALQDTLWPAILLGTGSAIAWQAGHWLTPWLAGTAIVFVIVRWIIEAVALISAGIDHGMIGTWEYPPGMIDTWEGPPSEEPMDESGFDIVIKER